MQHDEGKQQGQRNGERHDDGRTKIDQEENQDNQHQDHAAEQVVFHGIGGQLHQVAAIVKGVNLNVGREDLLVEFLGLSFDALENVLRLLSTQHENDAFHRIVVVLETEFAQPWRMADHDVANIFYANRRAVVAAEDDVANVVGVADQSNAAHVIRSE